MATSNVEDVFDESVSDINVGSKELEKLKSNLQKVRKVILHRSIYIWYIRIEQIIYF